MQTLMPLQLPARDNQKKNNVRQHPQFLRFTCQFYDHVGRWLGTPIVGLQTGSHCCQGAMCANAVAERLAMNVAKPPPPAAPDAAEAGTTSRVHVWRRILRLVLRLRPPMRQWMQWIQWWFQTRHCTRLRTCGMGKFHVSWCRNYRSRLYSFQVRQPPIVFQRF